MSIDLADTRYFELAAANKDGKFFDTKIAEAKAQTPYRASGFLAAGGALFILASAALVAAYLLNAHSVINLSQAFKWVSILGYSSGAGATGFFLGTAMLTLFSIKIHTARKLRGEKFQHIAAEQKHYQTLEKILSDAFGDNFYDPLKSDQNLPKREEYINLEKHHYKILTYKSGNKNIIINQLNKTIKGYLCCTQKLTPGQTEKLENYLKIKGYQPSKQ
jgi:hypothetical protein